MRRDAKTVEWLLLLRHHLQQGGLPGLSSPAGGGGSLYPKTEMGPISCAGDRVCWQRGPHSFWGPADGWSLPSPHSAASLGGVIPRTCPPQSHLHFPGASRVQGPGTGSLHPQASVSVRLGPPVDRRPAAPHCPGPGSEASRASGGSGDKGLSRPVILSASCRAAASGGIRVLLPAALALTYFCLPHTRQPEDGLLPQGKGRDQLCV